MTQTLLPQSTNPSNGETGSNCTTSQSREATTDDDSARGCEDCDEYARRWLSGFLLLPTRDPEVRHANGRHVGTSIGTWITTHIFQSTSTSETKGQDSETTAFQLDRWRAPAPNSSRYWRSPEANIEFPNIDLIESCRNIS
jgi:hypothetical protein